MVTIKTIDFCPLICIETFKLTFYKGCAREDVIKFLEERGMRRVFSLPRTKDEFKII